MFTLRLELDDKILEKKLMKQRIFEYIAGDISRDNIDVCIA